MTNITPLPFRGDLIDYLKLHGQGIEVLWRDGEAYIPIKPICDLLGLAYQPQHRKLTGAESDAVVTMMVTTGRDGKQYEMLCIAYPDFMMWLGNISASRVKPEAREAVLATRNEIKMVIATHYQHRLFGEIAELSYALEKLRMEAIKRKPIRATIIRAVELGWNFEKLWRSGSNSRPKLVAEIKVCLGMGVINMPPHGTPFHLAALAQLDMFGEM